MEKEKALELLDLDASATSQEIRSAYREMYNELQIRITNAPTDHQRKLYNRRLKELEEAYEVLGHSSAEDTGELPNIAPIEIEPPQDQKQKNYQEGSAQTEALKLLGLRRPFSEFTLENAYRSKRRTYEEVLSTAPSSRIEEGVRDILTQLDEARTLLMPLARGQGFAKDPSTKDRSDQRLLRVAGAFLVLFVVVLLTWSPWQQPPSVEQNQSRILDQDMKKEFIRLRSQGDALTETGNWEMALPKYEQALTILNDTTVADSIQRIRTRLESMAGKEEEDINVESVKKQLVESTSENSQPVDTRTGNELETSKEERLWGRTKTENTVLSYENYLKEFPQGRYATRAKDQIASITALKAEEETEEIVEIKEEEEIGDVPFAVIEEVPVFPGCEGFQNNEERKQCMSEKIQQLVNRQFRTELGSESGLSGINRIMVQFRIEKNGMTTVLGARAPHPILEQEAERVVNLLPKMQPGKQRGQAVGVLYSLPITFRVGGED